MAERARGIAGTLGEDAELLEAAALLHDIGYSPDLAKTGFHPLDGARYLRNAGDRWDPLPSQPSGLVFTTSTGRPIDPRSLNRMLDVLCDRAKVRHVRVHDLRHTCASLLLAQGVDPRTIMETLGHSTITMTLDTYAHVMDSTLRSAAVRMDDALNLGGEEDGDEGPAGVPALV